MPAPLHRFNDGFSTDTPVLKSQERLIRLLKRAHCSLTSEVSFGKLITRGMLVVEKKLKLQHLGSARQLLFELQRVIPLRKRISNQLAFRLGNAFLRLGEYRVAEYYLSCCANSSPHCGDTIGSLAICRWMQGDFDGGLVLLRKASRFHKRSGDQIGYLTDISNLIAVNISMGRIDEALHILNSDRSQPRGRQPILPTHLEGMRKSLIRLQNLKTISPLQN